MNEIEHGHAKNLNRNVIRWFARQDKMSGANFASYDEVLF